MPEGKSYVHPQGRILFQKKYADHLIQIRSLKNQMNKNIDSMANAIENDDFERAEKLLIKINFNIEGIKRCESWMSRLENFKYDYLQDFPLPSVGSYRGNIDLRELYKKRMDSKNISNIAKWILGA